MNLLQYKWRFCNIIPYQHRAPWLLVPDICHEANKCCTKKRVILQQKPVATKQRKLTLCLFGICNSIFGNWGGVNGYWVFGKAYLVFEMSGIWWWRWRQIQGMATTMFVILPIWLIGQNIRFYSFESVLLSVAIKCFSCSNLHSDDVLDQLFWHYDISSLKLWIENLSVLHPFLVREKKTKVSVHYTHCNMCHIAE